jgi:hypothetical protein
MENELAQDIARRQAFLEIDRAIADARECPGMTDMLMASWLSSRLNCILNPSDFQKSISRMREG